MLKLQISMSFFPIRLKHMLLSEKGNEFVYVVDYRMEKVDFVKNINRSITFHSNRLIVSTEKNRNKIL